MEHNWVNNEFGKVDLGDKRLNDRLNIICKRFSDAPMSPINQACEGWAETKAAYRFFENENVDYKEIIKSHKAETVKRTSDLPIILAVQDTSYFNYSNHPKTKGLCPLSKNKGIHKKDIVTEGLVMHSTLGVTTEGLVLGVIDQKIYSRPTLSDEEKKLKKQSHNIAIPIKEKDSYKWIESLENTVSAFDKQSSEVVTVCDREADIYDLFLRSHELNTNVLIRASHDRVINKKSLYSEITGVKLWELLRNNKSYGTIEVEIPKQVNKPARKAICDVTFNNFSFNPPRNHFDNKKRILPNLKLNAIHIKEQGHNTNKNDNIDWILLTNLPVNSFEEAIEKVRWYCIRWRIETWHKVLKSGLRVEDCRLETADKLIRYLSVMSIVAWRIFWVTLIGRIKPETSCLLFLNDIEWKILYRKFNKGKQIPSKPPSIKQVVNWIAQLGGFLARKNDGDPGITHVWRGLKSYAVMVDTVMEMSELMGNS